MADDDEEIGKAIAKMQEACDRARGYADFFDYPPDRDVAEVGVLESFAESLASDRAGFFTTLQGRGRGNDPPDCEALNLAGERIAIEVTELVSAEAIEATKASNVLYWREWDKLALLSRLKDALNAKDSKYPKLKGGPYPGGYVVVIHTDEPLLSTEFIHSAIDQQTFCVEHMSRAFLLLSHRSGWCPYFELALRRAKDSAG